MVTNVSPDHLGLAGVESLSDLAKVKVVVPQSVFRDGISVLNADNEWTAGMANQSRGEIIFFSMQEDNPVLREHLRNRGRAVLRQPGTAKRSTIVGVAGKQACSSPTKFRLRSMAASASISRNAMAATAAALGENIQLEYIRQALRTFTTSFFQTPGRFNLMEFQGRRVLMDYCHNIAGSELMAHFAKRMKRSVQSQSFRFRVIARIAISRHSVRWPRKRSIS